MTLKFLCDADFRMAIVDGLLHLDPRIDIRSADEAGLRSVHDLNVLAIAADQGRIVLTHDRRTMPHHFARFIQTRDSAGVIVVAQNVAVRTAIEEIYLVWAGDDANVWVNRISDIPLYVSRLNGLKSVFRSK
ncbi:MAG: DUF5615 family PIN-like protein [Acidobacteria bacterium]|nr:DUF5615 family PIN-like protein [Acidobacteriota bacterium]